MPGLEYFLLKNTDHFVTNISVRGGTNQFSVDLIGNFISTVDLPDLIIFMQCSFMRDYKDMYQGKPDGWSIATVDKNMKTSNLNWSATTIEDVIAPNFKNIKNQLEEFDIPVLVIGGNTKFHPELKTFPGVHTSCTTLAYKDFEDSYFDDSRQLEIFAKNFLKKSTLPTTEKYKLIDIEFKNFSKKMDLWNSEISNEYINQQHATKKLHYLLYQEVIKHINNGSQHWHWI